MSAELIIAGVKAIIRLSSATNLALKEAAVGQDILFPALNTLPQNPQTFVIDFFSLQENIVFVRGESAKYKQFWIDENGRFGPKQDRQSQDALLLAIADIQSVRPNQIKPVEHAPAALMVQQWVDGNKPLSPIARIAMAAADIALEYVGSNPGIIGGGNGAKLISAYAATLSEQLNDDGTLGPQDEFFQSLSGVLLRAGFDTIATNPQWIVSEEHFQALIKATVEPLAKRFPTDSDTAKIDYRTLTDMLMGPAANAILKTISEHQQAFLGDNFSTDKAIGALTKTLFDTAQEIGIEQQFTKDGLISTYQAVLGVIAEKPSLFIDNNGEPKQALLNELLGGLVSILKDSPSPYDKNVGIALAQTALQSIGNNAHRFADQQKSWEVTATQLTKFISESMADVATQNRKFDSLFSESQLIEYGRIVLTNIAKSPAMVIQSTNESKVGLIVAIANAMKKDDTLLLNADEWLEIVRVAATEAASNPMRLFDLDVNDPDDILAGKLITLMLSVASDAASKQKQSNVIFGETLTEAINILITASSGNVKAFEENINSLKDTLFRLNTFITAHIKEYGSKEWLRLFRVILVEVLVGNEVGEINEELILSLLSGSSE